MGGELFVDLRSPCAAWLAARQTTYCAGWACSEPTLTWQIVPKESFDGIAFVEKTSATRPTANAVASVARRAAH
jgi:hypothetical protein